MSHTSRRTGVADQLTITGSESCPTPPERRHSGSTCSIPQGSIHAGLAGVHARLGGCYMEGRYERKSAKRIAGASRASRHPSHSAPEPLVTRVTRHAAGSSR
jgi:hypothetical protein